MSHGRFDRSVAAVGGDKPIHLYSIYINKYLSCFPCHNKSTTIPFIRMTSQAPTAAAVRRMPPKFAGSLISSRTNLRGNLVCGSDVGVVGILNTPIQYREYITYCTNNIQNTKNNFVFTHILTKCRVPIYMTSILFDIYSK